MQISYEKFKKWCKEHQKEITVGVCFALIFLVGFGTGRYDKEAQSAKRKAQNNYSRTSPNQQNQAAGEVAGEAIGKNNNKNDNNNVAVEQAVAEGKCMIKGNINTKGKRVYHVPTGAFYKNTNPERCFNTEAEAQAAGFVKSSR